MIHRLIDTYTLPQVPSSSTEVFLIPNSKEFFGEFFESLQQAQESIYIANYLFEEGNMVAKLYKLLIEKARYGVKVVLVLDTVGSFDAFNPQQEEALTDAGVEIHYLHRVTKFWKLNERSHIRIFCVDQKVAYVGGVGFADQWFDDHYKDHMFQFKGELVALASKLFHQILEYTQEKESQFSLAGNTGKEVLFTTFSSGKIIYPLLLDLFNKAEKRIVVVSPYCIPPKEMIRSLEHASKRGVSVSLYTNKLQYTDHWYISMASCVVYARLLKRGVKIYTYNDAYIHNKLIITDDLLFGGTVNFDYRSLWVNHEIVYLSEQQDILSQAHSLIKNINTYSSEMQLSELKNLPWYRWFLNYFFYVFRRLM